MHFVMHSSSNLLASQVAKAYFKDEPLIVQLIQFTLLSNFRWRREEQFFYNDQVMQFTCLLAVYLYAVQKLPLLSAFFMTMALSLKASVIFYLPTFLGLMQYHYGIVYLIASLLVIISW